MVLKVAIVDSSYEERRQIENNVSWVENDFELVGETSNGEDALALLPHITPHVILTEIRLPKIDGITFIETAKKRWPDIKYIIVSKYDNFEYLQLSVNVGAYDYVLKPVKPNEINKVLLRAKQEIETGKKASF